jgi:hypothetical protein
MAGLFGHGIEVSGSVSREFMDQICNFKHFSRDPAKYK